MSGGKTPKPKAAPPIAIAPIAVTPEETEDAAMKKARRASGFEKTILTGSLAPENKGKKTTLG